MDRGGNLGTDAVDGGDVLGSGGHEGLHAAEVRCQGAGHVSADVTDAQAKEDPGQAAVA